MRCSTILFAAAMFAASAKAQIANFQVDDRKHFVIENYKPNSEVTFYPAMDGGQILKFTTVDQNGCLSFSEDLKFKPLRAYNPVVPDQPNVAAGAGKIETIPPREFAVAKFSLDESNGVRTVSWKGGDNEADEIEYRVFKSINGKDFNLFATYRSAIASKLEKFSVEDNAQQRAVYRIDVWNVAKNKLRYQSNLLSLSALEINVYPTLLQTHVNIDLLTDNSNCHYTVMNTLGQKLVTGILNTGNTKVDLSALGQGTYIVQVQNGKDTRSTKVVKVN